MAPFLLALFLVSILITAIGKYLKGDLCGPGHPPDLFCLYSVSTHWAQSWTCKSHSFKQHGRVLTYQQGLTHELLMWLWREVLGFGDPRALEEMQFTEALLQSLQFSFWVVCLSWLHPTMVSLLRWSLYWKPQENLKFLVFFHPSVIHPPPFTQLLSHACLMVCC